MDFIHKGGFYMREYQYCCVHPKSIDELNYIIDNEREITYNTLRKNVDSDSFKEVKELLGYNKQLFLDCGLTLQNDYAVSFHKSKLPDGRRVYYIRHSAIEYIFY